MLEAAGISLRAYGVLTTAFTLLGAYTAWRAHAWRDRVGDRALALARARAPSPPCTPRFPLAHGWLAAALLVSHGFALGVVPVVIADLMNRRIESSSAARPCSASSRWCSAAPTACSCIAASIALEKSSLSLVLVGFAAIAAAARSRAARDADRLSS